MNLLALELSSPRASIAWLDSETGDTAELTWERGRTQTSDLFRQVETLLHQTGHPLSSCDVFVVGRGPGNFSGMRMALSAAQGMALPLNREVRSVSSGRAAAVALLEQFPNAHRVAIMGDARRGVCWAAHFVRQTSALPPAEWLLLPPREARTFAAEADVVGTSEFERLSTLLGVEAAPSLPLVPVFPSALYLVRLAASEIAEGTPSEPNAPLYLHPPVA